MCDGSGHSQSPTLSRSNGTHNARSGAVQHARVGRHAGRERRLGRQHRLQSLAGRALGGEVFGIRGRRPSPVGDSRTIEALVDARLHGTCCGGATRRRHRK